MPVRMRASNVGLARWHGMIAPSRIDTAPALMGCERERSSMIWWSRH